MSLGKKIVTVLGTVLTGLLFLSFNTCTGGAGIATAPGGLPTNPSGGSLDNAATSKTDPSSSDDEPVADSYGDDGNIAQGSKPFPDPMPSVEDCNRFVYINLLKEKNVCLVSSDDSGKRVRIKLQAEVFAKCWNSNVSRLRIVDRHDHEFLDTKKIDTCSGGEGEFPCVNFTLTTSPHIFTPLNPENMKFKVYLIPPGYESKQVNVELPCREAGHCRFNEEHYGFAVNFAPSNLADIAARAAPCSTDSGEED